MDLQLWPCQNPWKILFLKLNEVGIVASRIRILTPVTTFAWGNFVNYGEFFFSPMQRQSKYTKRIICLFVMQKQFANEVSLALFERQLVKFIHLLN